MHPEPMVGLFTADAAVPLAIPLEGVRIDARLDGLALEVTVMHRYRNREAVPVEAVYVFPLEATAAVSGFAARVGDRTITGQVEEREAAFAAYDDATAEGHGAFLLDQERPNVFTASVGNLPPGQAVEVELRYVAVAAVEGAATRLMIPTTVSPRYVPPAGPEVGQPDGERVNPERRSEVPYGLTLTVDVTTAGALVAVESPSHPIRTRLRERGAVVELAQEDAALDRDFVLLVEAAGAHAPQALVAREEDGARVCMVSFAPDPATTPEVGSEVLFLLDCSGSMRGDSIHQARRALELCVRALSPLDTFNLTRFGSRHESLWPTPRPLDDRTLEQAVAWIRAADADLGGTEILTPLAALLQLPVDATRARQLLLLTDGEVSNEHEVIGLAGQHADRCRVFSFGIGAGASEHLVRGVAAASRGAAEFIFPGERVEPKVLRMFNRVRTPSFSDVTVDWGDLDVEQHPRVTPPVFAGDRLTVFGKVRSGRAAEVALSAGGQRWSVPVDLEQAPLGGPVPTLWARAAIADLESASGRGSNQRRPGADDRRRAELVDVAKRYGLMSSATSYVAIEERPEADRTTSPAALRRIPIALTVGWGGTRGLVAKRRSRPAPSGAGMLPPAPQLAAASPAPRTRGGGGLLARIGDAFGGMMPSRERAARAQGRAEADSEALDFMGAGSPRGAFLPATAPAEHALREDTDRLYDVLATQRADGSFRASAALRRWLGPRETALDAAIAAHGEAVAVTAVVLALFDRDEAARREEWRPAEQKARRWLAAQASAFDPGEVVGGE